MLALIVVRVAQLLIAGVVLGLSVVLIHGYGPGSSPAILSNGAFCGGATLIIAMVGIASCFIDKLQGVIMLGLDAFASFFVLAGAAAYAAKVKTGDCTNGAYLFNIYSVIKISLEKSSELNEKDAIAFVEGRCREAQADTAFLWVLFVTFLGSVALTFLRGKSTGRSTFV